MTNIQHVQEVRAQTGAGVMKAKQALEDANGNINLAIETLAGQGLKTAAKYQDRNATQGRIFTFLHGTRIGVLLEMSCETDFVARTDEFSDLGHLVALHIAAMAPESVTELLSQSWVVDSTYDMQSKLNEAISKLGEKIEVKRFVRFEQNVSAPVQHHKDGCR